MEETTTKIEMKNVASSNIIAMGHDKGQSILQVSFRGGRVYQYNPVSEEVYNDIIASNSIGTRFNELIKTNTSINYKKL